MNILSYFVGIEPPLPSFAMAMLRPTLKKSVHHRTHAAAIDGSGDRESTMLWSGKGLAAAAMEVDRSVSHQK